MKTATRILMTTYEGIFESNITKENNSSEESAIMNYERIQTVVNGSIFIYFHGIGERA